MPDHHPEPDREIIQQGDVPVLPAASPVAANSEIEAYIALLEEALIKAEAAAVILSAGGNVTLLLNHVAGVLELKPDGNGIMVTARQGEDEISPAEYMALLRQDPAYAPAFIASAAAAYGSASSVAGSGASITAGSNPTMLDPDNPLKLGQSLSEIARGSVRVRL